VQGSLKLHKKPQENLMTYWFIAYYSRTSLRNKPISNEVVMLHFKQCSEVINSDGGLAIVSRRFDGNFRLPDTGH